MVAAMLKGRRRETRSENANRAVGGLYREGPHVETGTADARSSGVEEAYRGIRL